MAQLFLPVSNVFIAGNMPTASHVMSAFLGWKKTQFFATIFIFREKERFSNKNKWLEKKSQPQKTPARQYIIGVSHT